MADLTWVVDTSIDEPFSGPSLLEAARSQGFAACAVRYVPIEREIRFDDSVAGNVALPTAGAVVFHGSVQSCNAAVRKRSAWTPGPFYREKSLSYAAYASRLGHLMINNNHIMLSFGEVRRRGRDWAEGMFGKSFFMRPNSVNKSFTGQLVGADTFESDFKSICTLNHVQDDEIVVLAKSVNISAEWRFIVAGRSVVPAGRYHVNGERDVGVGFPAEALACAQAVAALPWQADSVYTCDVGAFGPHYGVVELNAFSCSGLYAADRAQVVAAVGRVAIDEFNGIIDD
jgi:hypothetical protein